MPCQRVFSRPRSLFVPLSTYQPESERLITITTTDWCTPRTVLIDDPSATLTLPLLPFLHARLLLHAHDQMDAQKQKRILQVPSAAQHLCT